MSEEKKKNNLGTYAVIMILATIFIIIIASMADHREDHFESQINKQAKINETIQDQIVRLEDDNHKLKNENKSLSKQVSVQEQEQVFYQTISQVYALALDGKPEEASKKLLELDVSVFNEKQKAVYKTLQKQLQLPLK